MSDEKPGELTFEQMAEALRIVIEDHEKHGWPRPRWMPPEDESDEDTQPQPGADALPMTEPLARALRIKPDR